MRHPSFSVVLFAAAGALLGSGAASALTFDATVRAEQREVLEQDLQRMAGWGAARFEPDADAARIFASSALDGATLGKWLSERASLVLGGAYDDWLNRAVFAGRGTYPDARVFPAVEPATRTVESNANVQVEMMNISGPLYLAGKMQGQIVRMKFPDGSARDATSPRAGWILIGDGLFDPKSALNHENAGSEVNAIQRLSVLFHEARHGDGHGPTLAFFHAVCPKGHFLEGLNACDRNRNGPYAAEAALKKVLLGKCTTCSTADREALKASLAETYTRLLPNLDGSPAGDWDAAPETAKKSW